jgi:hypothetical protein
VFLGIAGKEVSGVFSASGSGLSFFFSGISFSTIGSTALSFAAGILSPPLFMSVVSR